MNTSMKIGQHVIGSGKVFIIAEIGSNHGQNINQAKELIDAAKECGADAVKFQSIKGNELYRIDRLSGSDKELLRSIELKEEWYKEIFTYARKKNIICLSAPTYLGAVDLLRDMDVEAFKIASPQTYGFPQLIDKVSEANLPTFMSIGYCTYTEIERAVRRFNHKDNLVLLHCTSNYPTKFSDVNLNFIKTLRQMFGTYVGFSDHTLGIHVAVAAAALGIDVLEKHITYSRAAEGPDHFFALEIQEFKEMVDAIREVEDAGGCTYKYEITPFENKFRDSIMMKCYSKIGLEEGNILKPEDIKYLRDDDKYTINAWDIKSYFGKRLMKRKEIDSPFYNSDFFCRENDNE